ncbi:MAG: DUF2721 domain-containing protein [Isosphaeraceae bacterium]
MPTGSDTYVLLSAMLTPAIFLTANGSLIISTSNRMSRVVDRIHFLNELRDKLSRGQGELDFPETRIEFIDRQLRALTSRSDRIRYSLVLQYSSFALFVTTSLVLAFDTWTEHKLTFLPTATAIAGVLLMLGSSVNLVREAMVALSGNRAEIRFYEELDSRRRDPARMITRSGDQT